MAASLKLTGDKALIKALDSIGAAVNRKVGKPAASAAMVPVNKAAKRTLRANKRTGQLWRSIGKKTKQFRRSGAREWVGSGIGNSPRPRAQGIAAASKAAAAVRTLQVQLDGLKPAYDEASPDSPQGLAWAALIGCVARCELRVDELIEAATPIKPTKNRPFVRREPASG